MWVVIKVLVLPLLVMLSANFIINIGAADPDPLTDFAMPKDPITSFVFRDIFNNGSVSKGPGGVRVALDTTIFPAMQSQSLTYTQFHMEPCGVNLPHTHPRASEMLTLIRGGPLQVGFVDTRGKAQIDILHEGDVIIFPRGLMHFELNVGTEKAFFISTLNSQNPGTLTSAGALLHLPARVLASSLNQDLDLVKDLEKNMHVYGPQLQLSPTSICTPGKDVTIEF